MFGCAIDTDGERKDAGTQTSKMDAGDAIRIMLEPQSSSSRDYSLRLLTVCPIFRRSVANLGAGEGNRTLVCSLGSCRSAIELHPQNQLLVSVCCFRLDVCSTRFIGSEGSL